MTCKVKKRRRRRKRRRKRRVHSSNGKPFVRSEGEERREGRKGREEGSDEREKKHN
jgi:hypothetical protein